MKETIQRLQALADRATEYNYPEDSNMGISISDIRAVLEFYESHKIESEPPNAPDITPEWDKIDSCYSWVAIDESGFEFSHRGEPKMDDGSWWSSNCEFQQTGRKFDMTIIDWTKTLSKRPAK